jgi:hypothetical protein
MIKWGDWGDGKGTKVPRLRKVTLGDLMIAHEVFFLLETLRTSRYYGLHKYRHMQQHILMYAMLTPLMQVIDELIMLVKYAKHRVDKRTSFQKAQHRLGSFYNRPAYQHTVTALLVVVGDQGRAVLG